MRPFDGRDLVEGLVEGGGQLLVHVGRVVTGDGDRTVAVAVEQRFELFLRMRASTVGLAIL